MSLECANRLINRVHLIDDDAQVRAGYRYSVEDLDLDADEVTGPISNVDDLINNFDPVHDAAICDFQLTTKRYSPQNGDELVCSLYDLRIPAVLCTRWAVDLPPQVRYRRRRIPVVLAPDKLNADTIGKAFKQCVLEFEQDFTNERRPWRSVVRVEGGEEAGGGYFSLSVVIPAWEPRIGLTFVVPRKGNPVLESICQRVTDGEVVRAFAQINLGADAVEDVYVDGWSLT